jgi:hypothetical protein
VVSQFDNAFGDLLGRAPRQPLGQPLDALHRGVAELLARVLTGAAILGADIVE